MSEVISTDAAFTAGQQRVLRILAEMMIPSGDDMPSAADPGIFTQTLGVLAPQADLIKGGLVALVQQVEGADFMALDEDVRHALVSELKAAQPPWLGVLQAAVVTSYYRDDRVLLALGLPARAPFPEGYQVQPTDWSLLDPVRARSPFYREV